MSYFLWVEDFDNKPGVTANNVLGGIIRSIDPLSNKRNLKSSLKSEGIYIELSFGDGLDFIQGKLADIDYIILDIDLPAYSGNQPNTNVLYLLEQWHDYRKNGDETKNEESLADSAKELKKIAGYYLYTELIFSLGFPKDHILFCSNHGGDVKSIQEAFKMAKILPPEIYNKSDPYVQKWICEKHSDVYSRLRRGIIEGCQYAKQLVSDKLYFNQYLKNDNAVKAEDISNYLEILEKFLPLREPPNKKDLYKLFIRTLSHEWEAANKIGLDKDKKDAVLAWIMRNTRHWITHNSALFNDLNEKIVAYLFIVNIRVILRAVTDADKS